MAFRGHNLAVLAHLQIPSPNRFWWGDDCTDAIMDNTWSMEDRVALRALEEAQRLIAEDAAALGFLHRSTVMAYRAHVKGFRMHPLDIECWNSLTPPRGNLRKKKGQIRKWSDPFSVGILRGNVGKLVGLRPERIVNLLKPAKRIGT